MSRRPVVRSRGRRVRAGVTPVGALRADIQALRAVAVVAVLLYHLWPSRLPGGYVGVDVFFVISGFLIGGGLIREAERAGTIDLGAFWTRRIRRLLPAALTVLVVSAIGVYLWVPSNLWPQFLREIAGATLYAENWVLAADSVDYLAATNTASPVQHYWTLSVEEQFYVLTPLLLLGLAVAGRRVGGGRRLLVAGIASVVVVSFIHSIALTATSAPVAYFATTTRAWEFGAGALTALIPRAPTRRLALPAFALGLVGIGGAAFLLSDTVPFPGAAAAVPVAATSLAILAGPAVDGWMLRLVRWRPVQFVGDVSYSAYLWHWPLIVLVPYALDRPTTLPVKLVIVAASLGLAWASTRYIEDPIRRGSRGLGPGWSRASVLAGAAAMSAVISVAAVGLAVSHAREEQASRDVARIVAEHGDCLGAAAIVGDSACATAIAPTTVVIDTGAVSRNGANRPECWAGVDVPDLHVCTLGPAHAAVRLVAIGDSHSNALLGAYEVVAERNGWRIDVAGHNGCYWTTAVQKKPAAAMVDACEEWKRRLGEWLDAQPPFDAILVTFARTGAPPMTQRGQDPSRATVDGLVAAWRTQTQRGTRIIAIRDNPRIRDDIVSCVVRDPADANARCSRPASDAVGATDPLVEAVALTDRAALIDLTSVYCPGGICIPVIGHEMVYSDRDHITGPFAVSLGPVLSERISAILRPGTR